MYYEISLLQVTKITVEADSEEQAKEYAGLLDGEFISIFDPHDYIIHSVNQVEEFSEVVLYV